MQDIVENWLNPFGTWTIDNEIYMYGMFLVGNTVWICSPESVSVMNTENCIPEEYLEVDEAKDLIIEDGFEYEIRN